MEIKGSSRWLAVLVGAALCLEAAGTVQASRPVLRVGIHDAGPDIGVADGAGAYHSINTDYMQILASYAGMDVVFVRGTARECEERLVRGEVDVLPGLVRTEARSRTMAFSRLPMGRGYTRLYLRGGQEALYSGEGSLLLGTLPGRVAIRARSCRRSCGRLDARLRRRDSVTTTHSWLPVRQAPLMAISSPTKDWGRWARPRRYSM